LVVVLLRLLSCTEHQSTWVADIWLHEPILGFVGAWVADTYRLWRSVLVGCGWKVSARPTATQQGAAPDRRQFGSFCSVSALFRLGRSWAAAGELSRCAVASFLAVSAIVLQVLAPMKRVLSFAQLWPQHRAASWFRSAQQSVAPDRKKRYSIHLLTASLSRRFLRQVNLALWRSARRCRTVSKYFGR
jgi:hypothetical protein